MKTIRRVKWDPIIVKLADYKLKHKICAHASKNGGASRIKANWVAALQKRHSKEDFQAFLHELFDNDGPIVKYQNPDAWRVYPIKKKTDDDTKS
jgi:hypothetical protein